MILNLDINFDPYPEQQKISYELITFAGGEPHIRIKDSIENNEPVMVTHRLCNFNNVGELLVTVNALRNMGVKEIAATLPYFPAARQDRITATGEALTAKVYTELINSLNLEEVVVYDVHSDVVPALLNNCKAVSNHRFIEQVTRSMNNDLVLISPDGGALKKVYKLATHLQKYDVVECSKSRDTATGKLSGFKVYADDLQQKDCLIVDDICDGGATFIGLAEELKKKNAGKLYLAVSHGIFSKGLSALTEHFDHIYTTDSFNNLTAHEQLTQINLSTLL